jgi:hypothetical protein
MLVRSVLIEKKELDIELITTKVIEILNRKEVKK